GCAHCVAAMQQRLQWHLNVLMLHEAHPLGHFVVPLMHIVETVPSSVAVCSMRTCPFIAALRNFLAWTRSAFGSFTTCSTKLNTWSALSLRTSSFGAAFTVFFVSAAEATPHTSRNRATMAVKRCMRFSFSRSFWGVRILPRLISLYKMHE